MAITEKDKIKKTIVKVLDKHAIKKAALFGSFARDEHTTKSDIDLLVKFAPGKSLLDLIDLKFELEDKLNRKVDIVTYQSLHPLLKDRILSEQEVIRG